MIEKLLPNASASYLNNDVQQSEIADQLGFKPDLVSKIGSRRGSHSVCTLNILGYIPGVSTLTGAYRALLGLAYLVVSAVKYIFDKIHRHHHLESMKIGATNLGRGLIEMVPVAGNLVAANMDVSRMMHRWALAKEYDYGVGIPVFNYIEMAGTIPVIGLVINVPMFLFYSAHLMVNAPLAVTGDRASKEAAFFALDRMGRSVLASVPLVGLVAIGFIQTGEESRTGVFE